jgi:hypothetical protein
MTTSTGTIEYTPQQRKLIVKHRDWNVEHVDWWDCTYDDFVEYAVERGFNTDPKAIHFRGFWSQGDGASFTGSIDVPTFIKFHKLETAYPWIVKLFEHGGSIWAKVERTSHGYAHENTCRAGVSDCDDFSALLCPSDFDIDDVRVLTLGQWDALLTSDIDQLEKDIEQTRLELCRHLYQQLEAEYDHLTSDDAVWDAIEANELHNQEEDDDNDDDQ